MKHELYFRVRYNEVDRMGYVHHGNYAAYFEMGRTELMRQLGVVYKEMEDSGIVLPLSEFKVKYHRPALYDEQLKLVTRLQPIKGVRIIFDYFLYNNNDELLAEGTTPMVFVDSTTRKPTRPPKELVERLNRDINL
jgi:acyl-CoA thioester hydrolase